MHRVVSRRTSAILRTGAVRHRNSAVLLSSSNPCHQSADEGNIKKKWYSVLATGSSNAAIKPFNLRNVPVLGCRLESTSAAPDASGPPAEKYEYQAEVSRLMDLIVNSLYSNKDVFLRELISNASDALDKLRFLSVTEPDLLKDAFDLDIRIQTDKDNGIITITDTGIGMTRQELVDCLGTIAQSGTAKFLKAMKESKDAGAESNLIGQFGVGFYSAFLVSERVEVSTKSPKSDKQYVWESEANSSSYTIREETDPSKLIPRGTRLTLYLKRDDKGFAHPERIQKLVQNYSLFVSFPIYTWQEKGYTKEVQEYLNHLYAWSDVLSTAFHLPHPNRKVTRLHIRNKGYKRMPILIRHAQRENSNIYTSASKFPMSENILQLVYFPRICNYVMYL